MQQKARVMQRNLRMVLILVDGKSTVADLSLKIGNTLLTENALAELEESGFVAPRAEQDSLWSEGKKVANEIRNVATKKAKPVAPQKTRDTIFGTGSDSEISMHSAFDDSAFPFPPMPFSSTGKPSPLIEENKKSLFDRISGGVKGAGTWFKSLFQRSGSTTSDYASDIAVTIKPIRRGVQKAKLTWSARLMIAFFALVILAVLLALLFPYNIYRGEVEAAMARSIGKPVTIGSIRAEAYPQPGLYLSDVRIGKEKTGFEFSEIRLVPEIGSIFDERKALRLIALSGTTLSAESIVALPPIFSTLNGASSSVIAKSVRFEKTAMTFGSLSVADMEGEAVLSTDGAFKSVHLRTPEGGLVVDAKPEGRGILTDIEGYGWRPSEKSPYRFDSLSIKGKIENAAFSMSSVELHIFDGAINGNAVVNVASNPSIMGSVDFERISAIRLGGALGFGEALSGDVSGKISFAAESQDWASLADALTMDGEISLRRGGIKGIDLAETVRRRPVMPQQGGSTQFEQFTAKIRGTPESYRMTNISMNSGLMQSAGTVEVRKDLQLDGKLDIQMRGTVNQMRVPVTLSGTLNAPSVRVETR